MSYANARRAYMTAAVQTVTPAQLVVMLYEGLLRNLDQAAAALEQRDLEGAHTGLVKAQAIVTELDVSLDTSAWPAGESLRSLYRFVEHELVTANVAKDVARITACRDLIAPLAAAWTQIAGTAASADTAFAASATA